MFKLLFLAILIIFAMAVDHVMVVGQYLNNCQMSSYGMNSKKELRGPLLMEAEHELRTALMKIAEEDDECCLGKPLEENVPKSELSPWPVYITDENMTEYFAHHTMKAARQILSDASVIANHNKEVEDFKLNLTTIVSRYEQINSELKNNPNEDQKNAKIKYEESLNEVVKHFLNITEYYYKLPEEKTTNDSKFISDILTKYDGYYAYKTVNAMAYAIGQVFVKVLEALFLDEAKEMHKQDIMFT